MVLLTNRKAKFDYEFLDKYNAGIQLHGSEVKAIKEGRVSVADSFCYISNGELFLKNLNITADNRFFQHEPNRDKKLLLKKREIEKIKNSMDKHLTIVPVYFYINERNKIKCEIAVSKGKKNYDKRETIKKRDIEREIKSHL
jgi:SsrA-binding protein